MSKPDHMPWLSVYLCVKDAAKAMEFYQSAFTFKPTDEIIRDDDGNIMHVGMQYEQALVMFGPEAKFEDGTKAPITTGTRSPVNMFIYCDDVDAFYKNAVANGADSEQAPENMFWGDRMCKLRDPDGHIWGFATHQSQ